MSTQQTLTPAGTMIAELNDFILRNMDSRELGWPCVKRQPSVKANEQRDPARSNGLRVLVVGELALELPIEVEATRAELADLFRGGGSATTPTWKMQQLRVGGFVGHAVEAAAKLGARVSVCTCVPVPTPACIEAFLDENAVDRRFVTGIPGRGSIRTILQCKDGEVAFEPPPYSVAQRMDLPASAASEVDAILVDPCALADQGPLARSLSRCLHRSSDNMTVGLRLNHRTDLEDFPPIRDSRVWTFLRRGDGLRLARHELESDSEGREFELVRHLHDRFKIAKVVVQLGSQGAVMMNGLPCPYRVHTCPVSRAKFTSAADTLLAVTTLSSASGANDKTSLRRGVAAATGQVAGLDFPTSFEELDAE